MSAAVEPIPADLALAEIFAADPKRGAGQAEAWEAFEARGLPHRRVEEWKWSDLARVAPGDLEAAPEQRAPKRPGVFSDLGALEIVFVDGRFVWWSEDDPDAESVVHVKESPDAPNHAAERPLAALAASLAADDEIPLIVVPKDFARPVWLRFIGEAANTARMARVGVLIQEGAEATILESYEADTPGFSSVLVEAFLEDGARLDRVVVQSEAADDVLVSTADVKLSANAVLNQTTLAFGAKLARLETHVRHQGEGASATLDGAYLLDGNLHADQTTTVTHDVPHGVTRETFKGAVTGKATGVFQGKIKVERAAQKTDARMRHDALLLSNTAAVNAKPELEIYADDVECAHGATVGALDPAQLFYMQSRGLEESRAKALLIEAFLGEAVDGVADKGTRARLRELITSWLGTRL